MKEYGESVFDILYLLLAIIVGVRVLILSKNNRYKLMGFACLVLGCGDAFHLVPRMLNYFVDGDFSTATGIGKLITSVTMTVFYVLLYHIYLMTDGVIHRRPLTIVVYALAAVRIILCIMPQNNWLTNDSPYLWGIWRNIPFVILGAIIVVLYFSQRKNPDYRFLWLYITLSFAFYLVVVLGAAEVPALGAFMLPKTVCYVLVLLRFYGCVRKSRKAGQNDRVVI